MKSNVLPEKFYTADAPAAAPALLGKKLVHVTDEGETSGIIVETEAYCGAFDKGSHAYQNKKTERTRIQFGPGGFAYVYLIYGMYACFNVVTAEKGVPDAVLVRALHPVSGIDLMEKRRSTADRKNLCSGPGKLCRAMDITTDDYGLDLRGRELFITDGIDVPKSSIMTSPRINIDYAEECADYMWRFYIKDDPFVSKVPAKYRKRAKRLTEVSTTTDLHS